VPRGGTCPLFSLASAPFWVWITPLPDATFVRIRPSTLLVVSRCVTDGTCATGRCLTSRSVSPTARRRPPRRASAARCRWWRRVCGGGGQPHSCGGGVLAPRCGLRGGGGGLGGLALFSGVVLTVWVNGHVVSGGAAAARDAVPGRAVRHRAGTGGSGGAGPKRACERCSNCASSASRSPSRPPRPPRRPGFSTESSRISGRAISTGQPQ